MNTFSGKPKTEKTDYLPKIFKNTPEIKGVILSDKNFINKFTKISNRLSNFLIENTSIKEKDKIIAVNRLDSLKSYINYPIVYQDIFDTDHENRRHWKKNLPKEILEIYEKQKIRKNERMRLNDMISLIMTLVKIYPNLAPLLEEALMYEEENYKFNYESLSTDDKISYVKKFDDTIYMFLKNIHDKILIS